MEKKQTLENALTKSRSFSEYLDLIKELHKEEKATSFQEDAAFYNYSKLGFSRMKRVYKTVEIITELENKIRSISEPQTWLLITESWCGDASQTVPIIAKLAEINEKISLRIALRDSEPELMEHYLTNGGMSIPILAVLDEELNELHRWGPRPEYAQNKIIEYKNLPEPKPSYSELSEELQRWYNQDKGVSTQKELLDLF